MTAPASAIPNRPARWPTALLALITLALHAPAIGHAFVMYDDWDTLVQNQRLNPPAWSAIPYYWRHESMSLWIPITHSIWVVLAELTYVQTPDEMGIHLDPRIYHGVNLLVHTGAVLAAYALLRRLLSSPSAPPRTSSQPAHAPANTSDATIWPAFAGALLLALHPLAVEAVCWASGLKDLLYTAFSLTALLLYIKAAREGERSGSLGHPERSEGSGSSGGSRRSFAALRQASRLGRPYWLGALCLALALLSKPTAAVTPLLAAALDRLVLRRPWRKVAASALPWLALAIPILVIGKFSQPAPGVWRPPLCQRPIVAGASLVFYVWKLVLPLRLAPDYGLRPHEMLEDGWALAGTAVLVAAAILIISVIIGARRRRRRQHNQALPPPCSSLPLAGVAFFAIALLPTLGFVPFLFQFYSTVADHYVQLALFGAAIVLAWLTRVTWRWPIARIMISALLCAWTVLTVRQQRTWLDTPTLYAHELAVNPKSFLAHANLGVYHQWFGDTAAAEREYRRAIALGPELDTPRVNLANILAGEGRIGEAIEIIDDARRVNAARPPAAQVDMSNAYGVVGQNLLMIGHPAWAMPLLERQLELTPTDPEILAALARARAPAPQTQPTTTRAQPR
jgi:tetratricopeptide (TPR) repeat protein